MISINTDELEQSVQIARRANEAITNVANLLNSIAVHNDWICTSRDLIIQNTNIFRSDSLKLQEDSNSYYTAILNATNRFLETEKNMVSKTNEVDGLISMFLSKVPSAGGGVSQVISGSSVKQQISSKGGGGGHAFGNTVSFQDLASSLHDDGGLSLLNNK